MRRNRHRAVRRTVFTTVPSFQATGAHTADRGTGPARHTATVLTLLLIMALGGCPGERHQGASSDVPAAEQSAFAAGDTLLVRDDLGRELRFETPPRRVVSLAPSITETVFAVGAGDAVVGVTSYCDYPPAATERTRMGDMLAPDLERILSVRPDLVMLSMEGNRRETFDALERYGVPVFVSHPATMDAVLASIRTFGRVFGTVHRAEPFADSLAAVRDSISAARRRGTPVRVLMLLSTEPLIVAGSGTVLDEMIHAAGGENAGASGTTRYPSINREEVLLRDPDILVLPHDLAADAAALVRMFPEWRTMTAIRRGMIARLDANLLLRPGPRMITGLRALAEWLERAQSGARR